MMIPKWILVVLILMFLVHGLFTFFYPLDASISDETSVGANAFAGMAVILNYFWILDLMIIWLLGGILMIRGCGEEG